MRNIRRESNTLTIPLTAIAAILWGVLFYINVHVGRSAVPGFVTTLNWLPYWAWSTMFITAGGLLLWRLTDWAVVLLAMVMSLYTFTLAANILVTDTASLTPPIWLALAVTNLITVAYRAGVRKPGRR